jgi:hypothetical protein
MAESEYVQGSMDIHEQQGTFALFWSITKWSSIAIGIALVLLALTRTGAVDCKNSEQAAQHINSCGKATVAAPEAPAHE